ncbi:hypothetical protein TNCT_737371, partial [Trichonephila clavata]
MGVWSLYAMREERGRNRVSKTLINTAPK